MDNSAVLEHAKKADRTMLFVLLIAVVYSLGLATLHGTWGQALVIGGITAATGIMLLKLYAGQLVTRLFMGMALMIMTALHVNQSHGMIEMHFGFFAFLALLLYYHDWRPIVLSAGLVAVHHLLFYYLQQQGTGVYVLDADSRSWGIIILHAGYVVVETAVLVVMAVDLRNKELAAADLQSTVTGMVAANRIDLTQRCQLSSPISQNFNQVIGQIHESIKVMEANDERLDQAIEQLKVIMHQNTGEMEHQVQEHQQVATAISQMISAIQSIAQNAELAAGSAQTAQSAVQRSSQLSQATQNTMQQLGSEISQASTAIEGLAAESDSIGSVLDVIRGIAEQTNLLALNAAIEAARAGEQGRGFAVVADEVRSLASRTQESTQEIHRMIEKLQNGTNHTVEAMSASQGLMTKCLQDVVTSNNALHEVVESIQQILSMNTQIAAATTEQESVIGSVANNVNSMQSISDHLSGIQETSESLRSTTQEIRQAIARFHV